MNQQKLVDASKVIADMEQRIKVLRSSPSDYNVSPVINTLQNYIDRLQSDCYLPDPVSAPELNPEDQVTHQDHPQYGVGRVIAISKSGKRARVEFPEVKSEWGWLDAYYRIDKLEVYHG